MIFLTESLAAVSRLVHAAMKANWREKNKKTLTSMILIHQHERDCNAASRAIATSSPGPSHSSPVAAADFPLKSQLRRC